MIIRCPQCEHTRSINENKIPPTAELATCPKCKHRFRFRALEDSDPPSFAPGDPADPPGSAPKPRLRIPAFQAEEASPEQGVSRKRISPPSERETPPYSQQVQRPQSAFREVAEQNNADIWDAVDALHQRWEKQIEKNVTEVVTPQPAKRVFAPPPPDAGTADYEIPQGVSSPVGHAFPPSRETADPFPQNGARPEARPRQDAADPFMEKTRESENPYNAAGYDKDAPPPEEVVERDMRMLLQAPSEKLPFRDLGTLEDITDAQGLKKPGEESPPSSAPEGFYEDNDGLAVPEVAPPWETPATHGWLKAFLGTIYSVMFQGPAFFSSLSKDGPLGPGYLFFLILGYIAILGSVVWAKTATLLAPDLSSLFSTNFSLPALLLVAPLALGLLLLFVTGCMRLQLRIVAPDNADFGTIYRITAYSVAPFMLSIVPFIGPAVGAAWFIFALVMGCRHTLRLSWGLAVTVPLPPAVLLLASLFWYFL